MYSLLFCSFYCKYLQSSETELVDIYDKQAGRGVCGRMLDVLKRNGYQTGATSISGAAQILTSSDVSPSFVNAFSPNKYNSIPWAEPLKDHVTALSGETSLTSGLHGETWADLLTRSLGENEILYDILTNTTLNNTFPSTKLGDQFKSIAKLIQKKDARGTNRDIFYARDFTYDFHSQLLANLDTKTTEIDEALNAFSLEMKNISAWKNVTIVFVSEFARTLLANTGDGSDHAW